MARALARYLNTYGVQIKNNWVREVVYRTNFITGFTVDLIWIFVEFGLFSVIYANTNSLAGWSREQIFFFLGIFFASDALFGTLFQRNFWQFSDLVNKGELDILLTKPVHPLFLALSRWISITSILNFFLGIGIAYKYGAAAGFAGGAHWFLAVFWIFLGLVAQALLRFTFCIWIFWTERSFALAHLYYQFYQLATKPDTIYPRAVRFAIMTFVPFAFIGSVPTRALLHGLSGKEYAGVALVLIAFFALNSFLWRRGLKRYQSASS